MVTTCDICGKNFAINAETLTEKRVELEKDDLVHEVTLTFLSCPLCGKQYAVIMDDETTLPLLEELRTVLAKIQKFRQKSGKVPEKLREKYEKINQKLDFKRRQLAEKFDGSVYQTDEGKEQLDYRYHTR